LVRPYIFLTSTNGDRYWAVDLLKYTNGIYYFLDKQIKWETQSVFSNAAVIMLQILWQCIAEGGRI